MSETVNWYEPTQEQLDEWQRWLKDRPPKVREVAERFPPWTLWRMDYTGEGATGFQRVYVMSYGEPEEEGAPVTMTVAVDGRFNCVAFERGVFGIDPVRLKPTTLPGHAEPVGSAGLSPEQAAQMAKRHQS